MASKAAYKRVCFVSVNSSDVPSTRWLTKGVVEQGVCLYAERATPVRLGRTGREEHPQL